MHISYIGITDFMTYEQVENMLAVFNGNINQAQKLRLHVGVMMSFKTLNGLTTKWAPAFPKKEDISKIFSSNETMNCLHYADYDGIDVTESLTKAISFGGDSINALQLDMVWPDENDIRRAVHDSGKKLEVILQINSNAISEAGNCPGCVAGMLRKYEGIIHHVLLDKSMGRGIGMDAELLLPYVEEIRKSFPDLGITVAGGLGPKTINLALPIIQKFDNISIDAQGQLRKSGNALDPIDWDLAEEYLLNALKVII